MKNLKFVHSGLVFLYRFLPSVLKPPSRLFIILFFAFYRVSYCRMAANLPSKDVIPLLPVSSVRAGPHYSLLRLLALRLQSLILDSPSLSLPVMLQAQALSPKSTKLPWMCTAIHTRQTLPNISSHCWWQNIVPTCPQFRTERHNLAQSHWECKSLVLTFVLYIQLMLF